MPRAGAGGVVGRVPLIQVPVCSWVSIGELVSAASVSCWRSRRCSASGPVLAARRIRPGRGGDERLQRCATAGVHPDRVLVVRLRRSVLVPAVPGPSSKSLKKGGIFILCEPSSKNPFASVGRRILKGFHTPGEKPLEPSEVQGLAEKNGLTMVYQKGEHFLTGPMEYLLGLRNVPVILVKLIYYLTTKVDLIIRSPSYNYDFIQAYKKL